jgi:hypothetical protein
MSFDPTNITRNLKVTGLNEAIRGVEGIIRGMPLTRGNIVGEAANFFAMRAREKVHRVSHRLAQNTGVEAVSPAGAIVSARTRYAETEENRPGNKPGIETPHRFMAPSAEETIIEFPNIIIKRVDALLAENKSI